MRHLVVAKQLTLPLQVMAPKSKKREAPAKTTESPAKKSKTADAAKTVTIEAWYEHDPPARPRTCLSWLLRPIYSC